MATVRGHKHTVYGEPLADWEKAVILAQPINAPFVPCPKCTSRQWVREKLGYTCLTCGKEALHAPDGECLRNYPYNDRDRLGVPSGYTAGKEHPRRKGINSSVWGGLDN